MRFGITLLTDEPWSRSRERWQQAEAMGFDHAWTYDHLTWGGLPDSPWTTPTPVLGAAAQVTERIGLGLLVSSPNFRDPYLLFRDAQALEDVSGGRFLLGVGAGGDRDSEVLGGPDLTRRERTDRFGEFVASLDALRHNDHVTTEGRWFSSVDARTLPGLDRTPLLVAANGPKGIALAAAHGDGWITLGTPHENVDDWFGSLATSINRWRDASAGLAPRPSYLLLDSAARVGGFDRVSLSSVGYFEDLVGRADDLGFTDVICHWPRDEQPYAASRAVLDAVAAEVLPRWRAGRAVPAQPNEGP